jgi:hypothetical protein
MEHRHEDGSVRQYLAERRIWNRLCKYIAFVQEAYYSNIEAVRFCSFDGAFPNVDPRPPRVASGYNLMEAVNPRPTYWVERCLQEYARARNRSHGNSSRGRGERALDPVPSLQRRRVQ